jgi:hypothetical protein
VLDIPQCHHFHLRVVLIRWSWVSVDFAASKMVRGPSDQLFESVPRNAHQRRERLLMPRIARRLCRDLQWTCLQCFGSSSFHSTPSIQAAQLLLSVSLLFPYCLLQVLKVESTDLSQEQVALSDHAL